MKNIPLGIKIIILANLFMGFVTSVKFIFSLQLMQRFAQSASVNVGSYFSFILTIIFWGTALVTLNQNKSARACNFFAVLVGGLAQFLIGFEMSDLFHLNNFSFEILIWLLRIYFIFVFVYMWFPKSKEFLRMNEAR